MLIRKGTSLFRGSPGSLAGSGNCCKCDGPVPCWCGSFCAYYWSFPATDGLPAFESPRPPEFCNPPRGAIEQRAVFGSGGGFEGEITTPNEQFASNLITTGNEIRTLSLDDDFYTEVVPTRPGGGDASAIASVGSPFGSGPWGAQYTFFLARAIRGGWLNEDFAKTHFTEQELKIPCGLGFQSGSSTFGEIPILSENYLLAAGVVSSELRIIVDCTTGPERPRKSVIKFRAIFFQIVDMEPYSRFFAHLGGPGVGLTGFGVACLPVFGPHPNFKRIASVLTAEGELPEKCIKRVVGKTDCNDLDQSSVPISERFNEAYLVSDVVFSWDDTGITVDGVKYDWEICGSAWSGFWGSLCSWWRYLYGDDEPVPGLAPPFSTVTLKKGNFCAPGFCDCNATVAGMTATFEGKGFTIGTPDLITEGNESWRYQTSGGEHIFTYKKRICGSYDIEEKKVVLYCETAGETSTWLADVQSICRPTQCDCNVSLDGLKILFEGQEFDYGQAQSFGTQEPGGSVWQETSPGSFQRIIYSSEAGCTAPDVPVAALLFANIAFCSDGQWEVDYAHLCNDLAGSCNPSPESTSVYRWIGILCCDSDGRLIGTPHAINDPNEPPQLDGNYDPNPDNFNDPQCDASRLPEFEVLAPSEEEEVEYGKCENRWVYVFTCDDDGRPVSSGFTGLQQVDDYPECTEDTSCEIPQPPLFAIQA